MSKGSNTRRCSRARRQNHVLLAFEPFESAVKNENPARNLAILSQLMKTFQNHDHYHIVTHRNRDLLRFHLFNSFLRLLPRRRHQRVRRPGPAVPERPRAGDDDPPSRRVWSSRWWWSGAWTVRSSPRAKADRPRLSGRTTTGRRSSPRAASPSVRPDAPVTMWPSRDAEKVLVLTARRAPQRTTSHAILAGAPAVALRGAGRARRPNGSRCRRGCPSSGPTASPATCKSYETCPRQYQFFREYDFTPSRSAVIFFGLLVHQTIEEIHRIVLDGKLTRWTSGGIRELFERTFRVPSERPSRPIGDAAKEAAFTPGHELLRPEPGRNAARASRRRWTCPWRKSGYILDGQGGLAAWKRWQARASRLQDLGTKHGPCVACDLRGSTLHLCAYSGASHGKRPERLLLDRTAEPNKTDALMEMPYTPEKVDGAGRRFDGVVAKIRAGDFKVSDVPERKVCKECDLKSYCTSEGLIESFTE